MRCYVSGSTGMSRCVDIYDKATLKDGRETLVKRNWFINPDEHDGLAAYRIEIAEPGSVVAPHFHLQDQFQVFVDKAGCRLGVQPLSLVTIQYADACSPYGPLIGGPEGVAFFVFRLRRDQGAFIMPEARAKMTQKPGRNVVAVMADGASNGVESLMEDHADGLATWRLAARAGARIAAPDPARGGGQYLLVLRGSARVDGKDWHERSCLFASPDETAFKLNVGPDGLEALLVQFPRQSWEARLLAASH